ncbi:hypothetical protein [Mycetocola spongiae]|uniref:hypothetical protein n=1 Tax=Mycetocola spongiae TaxID=2859226 RepID=UPI001CF19775|nr:hypothetical protein [Mycetocola spongiae]UCR89234.1 hypothetical protein KXZ72_00530 [Mycetocola spongiae]
MFSTRDEAVQSIITAIEATGEATAAEYNLDAIAEDLITFHDGAEGDTINLNAQGFTVDEDAFWQSVENHAL